MLDENGFKKKTYAELIEEMEAKAREGFGETINLSPRSFLGILIRLYAWFLAIVWQVIEKVYNNSFPGTAEGVSLDRAVRFKGISRNLEEYAYGKVKIRGTPGATIETGFIVGTKNNIYFETTEDAVLDEIGEAIVEIYAEEKGTQGNVAAGEITEILYPDPEVIFEVINLEPTAGGTDRETDTALYTRYQSYPPNKGSSDLEGIQAELLEIPGVRDAIVSQNTSMVEKDGIPPKSIAPFVFGGTDLDVAKAIFGRKAGGIQSFGSTVVEVFDSKNIKHYIGFTRPEIIQIYVRVTLTKKANFPSDGIEIVRAQILNYIGGENESGTEYPGLGLKQNVIINQIVWSIIELNIVDDVAVELSTDGVTYTSGNITVLDGKVAKTSFDKVVVS